jgi:hypothetical protein
MRTFGRGFALAVLLGGAAAHADANDLEITKLRLQSENAATANANFRAFARTFGAAMSSVNLMPPETLGHAAFSFNAELGIIQLPALESVRLPTQREQSDTLLLPSVHVRKGLPFSLELGARVGWVDKSRLFATTGELKWAVNEGFTYLPDIAVRAHVTRLMGNRDFDLTTGGLDFGVGKQFPLGGMVTLTPYGGLDFVAVAASTDVLDFDQNRDVSTTLDPADPYAGLENTGVFQEVKLMENVNQRIYGGARFITGALQLGVELSLTRAGSFEYTDDMGATATRDLPAVLAFSTTLGLDF